MGVDEAGAWSIRDIEWLKNGMIVLVAYPSNSPKEISIYLVGEDGTGLVKLSKPSEEVVETLRVLFASPDGSSIYWVTGTECHERGICHEKYFWTKLDDSEQRQIWQNVQAASDMVYASPSGKYMIYYAYFGWSQQNGCVLADMEGQLLSAVELDGWSSCSRLTWSPVEDKLLLRGATKVDGDWHFKYRIWSEPGNVITELPGIEAAFCSYSRWTPDGKGIFLSGCGETYAGKEPLGARLINIEEGAISLYPDTKHCASVVSSDSRWALLYRCITTEQHIAPSQLLNLETKELQPVFAGFQSDDAKAAKTAWPIYWLPASGARPEASAESPTAESAKVSDKDGMVLLYVPSGEFRMGLSKDTIQEAPELAVERFATKPAQVPDDAKPEHAVDLGAFWIDQTEVSNRMYLMCIADGACSPPEYYAGSPGPAASTSARRLEAKGFLADDYDLPEAADLPVINVTWDQAQAYCAWAGRQLPTEAQWEKAARGTDGRLYPWGDEWPPMRSWLNNYFQQPVQIGSHPDGASPYGALDMAGNVWEFVADWYAAAYYASSPTANPTGPMEGAAHVIRGGSFASSGGMETGAFFRTYEGAPGNTSRVGFRCASASGE
jgi:formylglycine-generating enzyme required for sulfatase activity